MKFRFTEDALKAGEAVLTSFSNGQLTNRPNIVIGDTVSAVIDNQVAYLATLLPKHKRKWPNLENITAPARGDGLFADARDIIDGLNRNQVANRSNQLVARIIDSVLTAQGQLIVPGQGRWINYT